MSLSTEHLTESNRLRVNRILEVIISYARLDFRQKTNVAGNGDVLDAIGAGVNMLGEELETSTVSLREKEQLLKEVHHRVKNNMQIVSSLLKLQSETIPDQRFLDLINDSRNRIQSMALVHEMLYSSKDLSKIEISEYIMRLSQSIDHSFSKPDSDIIFEYNIQQNLYFDVDVMIPIGLIINEIVSNSYKYAFPKNKGLITIELLKKGDSYNLMICDDGIGFPKSFDLAKDSNLGMQLIFMLTEQMEGTIKTTQEQGTAYHIEF